jgi:hypothetical protein
MAIFSVPMGTILGKAVKDCDLGHRRIGAACPLPIMAATVMTPATVMSPVMDIRLTPPMATTVLAITDTPLGRIRAIAVIMRQHGSRIMRIGRAGKEMKAAAS